MDSHIKTICVVTQRIETLTSLLRVFDLIHHHYSNDSPPHNFRSLEEVYESRTSLYILIISYLYSLFDKSGVNIIDIDKASLSQSSRDELNEIVELWKPLENPITRIRHNLGFHGGGLPQIKNVLKAADEIDKNNLLPSIVVLFDKLKNFGKILECESRNKPHGT